MREDCDWSGAGVTSRFPDRLPIASSRKFSLYLYIPGVYLLFTVFPMIP